MAGGVGSRWTARHRGRPQPPQVVCVDHAPYPSGNLHTGHWYAFTPSDAGARYRRMLGYDVFFPVGFDAFGLPAENAAIKNNIHPKVWTYKNMERIRDRLRQMGAMWAWDREAATCDPDYYKWSQWFLLKLYDMGLAYREFAPVDWCPNCNTTLAREQVWGDDRHCERCGTPVIKKELNQGSGSSASPEIRRRTAGRHGQDRLAGAGEGDAEELDRAQ